VVLQFSKESAYSVPVLEDVNRACRTFGVTDSSGLTPAVTWTQVSGPGTVKFANPNQAVTTASFSQAGTYIVHLTILEDSNLLTGNWVTPDHVVQVNQRALHSARERDCRWRLLACLSDR
jgi:hypothetical protein